MSLNGFVRDQVVQVEAVDEDLLKVHADVSHEIEIDENLHEHDGVRLALHLVDVVHAPPDRLGRDEAVQRYVGLVLYERYAVARVQHGQFVLVREQIDYFHAQRVALLAAARH